MSLPEVYPPAARKAAEQPLPSWVPGSGLVVPAVAGVCILIVGILVGRVEIAGLALPLLLGLAWNWQRRPEVRGFVELTAPSQTSEDGRLRAVIRWHPADGADQLRISVSAPGHQPADVVLARPGQRAARSSSTDHDPEDRPGEHELDGAAGEPARTVGVSMRSVRTGRRGIFVLNRAEQAAGQVLAQPPQQIGPLRITVLPHARALRELPLPPRLQGLTGPHDSARPGDGGDLRDVNLFTPGDRLRRIDWRVTARHAGRAGVGSITDLYVRRSFSTADATVMLVLDSRDEVGADVTTWGDVARLREDQQTSLDHARNAAATVARCYLEAGDRVGLEDLGRLRRPVPPSGGRRQLQRLRERIALAEPEGEPKLRRRVPRFPSGSLIVIFSTFLDDEAVRLAQGWRGSGHRVIAIDVLPPLELAMLDPRQQVAYRIVAMERADRLAELRRSDVEVVRWIHDPQDPTSLPIGVAMTALARRRVRR